MLRSAFLTAILGVCCLGFCDLGAAPLPPIRKSEEAQKPNRTVIPGTWAWSIETNKLGRDRSDLFWSHKTNTERDIVPSNGASLAVITVPFEQIDLKYFKAVEFTDKSVAGSDNNNLLKPGTILAVRTVNGNFAKLKVIRYYTSHDFTFPGSEILNDDWKQFSLQRPIIPSYHIEFEWVLYKSK
jgi:hypothetical protein